MGLFRGSSKSSSSTSYKDYSQNQNLDVDLSSGDLSSGAQKNIIAGGDLKVDGLSEDLASKIFSVVQDAYGNATDFVKEAINDSNKFTQQVIGNNDNKTQATVEMFSQNLKEAYNSEQATINSFKTYALYALIAFIAWAYLKK